MLGLLPLAIDLAPTISKWLFGPSAGDTAKAITDVVQTVTGTSDAAAAQAAIDKDPQLAAQLKMGLAKIVADREAAAAANQLEILKQAIASQAQQTALAQTDATSNDAFQRRWRPCFGWVCAAGMAWYFVLSPLWSAIEHMADPTTFPVAQFDVASLMYLVTGMLGLGGMRTYEKLKGVA